MKLDFLTCGSATDAFFGCVAFARQSLDALGGIYREARLVAAFGDTDSPRIPDRWAPHFENIEVIWANPDGLPNPTFTLQHEARFDAMRDDADVAVIVDADVCQMRPCDDLLAEVCRDGCIAAVQAHYHFPVDKIRGTDPGGDWDRVARAVLGRPIPRPYRYLYGLSPEHGAKTDPEQRPHAPFYPNYGMVMAPPARIRQMVRHETALRPAVSAVVGEYWSGQIGVALACADLDLPVRALPPRYNYCNRPETDVLYPEELDRIVFFHYMKGPHILRKETFRDPERFRRFVGTPLTGADERMRQHVLAITGGRYPYPDPAAPPAAR